MKFDLMNEYLSNLAVMNVKLHNLHWNVVGINFVSIHNFTEELYDKMFETFDAVAEHLKMQGQVPLSQLKVYLEKATIKEIEPKEFSTKEVLTILIEDIEVLRAQALKIRNVADEESDFTAVAMFEGEVAAFDKNLWFLKAMIK